MTKNSFIIAAVMVLSSIISFAQTAPVTTPKPELEEIKTKLNEDGSHFIKFTFSNQTWLRFNQSNPGTTVIGERANQTVDIGLRRTRMQLFGQISDHAFFYT